MHPLVARLTFAFLLGVALTLAVLALAPDRAVAAGSVPGHVHGAALGADAPLDRARTRFLVVTFDPERVAAARLEGLGVGPDAAVAAISGR